MSLSLSLSVCLCLSVCLSLGLTLLISYVAKVWTLIVFCFVLKMHFSLPHLSVLFDLLSVAVFVIRDRFVKKPTCA